MMFYGCLQRACIDKGVAVKCGIRDHSLYGHSGNGTVSQKKMDIIKKKHNKNFFYHFRNVSPVKMF